MPDTQFAAAGSALPLARGAEARSSALAAARTSQTVVVLRNARSGRERAVASTIQVISALRERGFDVRTVDLSPSNSHIAELELAATGARALVIAGGDGTVHHNLSLAARLGVPVYHLPLGNENLFSREFGMTIDEATLIRSIDRAESVPMDLGVCNGRLFALMASVGFDACVVERVAAKRTAGISHHVYARHVLAEIRRPRWHSMSVIVDGVRRVENATGWLIIANSRQYGARLDPARSARTDDALLDVVFMPARTRLDLVRWAARLLAGAHLDHPSVLSQTATSVEVNCLDGAFPVQIDGECAGQETQLSCRIAPGALNALRAR